MTLAETLVVMTATIAAFVGGFMLCLWRYEYHAKRERILMELNARQQVYINKLERGDVTWEDLSGGQP